MIRLGESSYKLGGTICGYLSAQQIKILLRILAFHIIQETTTATDHTDQTTLASVIATVVSQMSGELGNPTGQNRYLNFRRTGIRLAPSKLADQLFSSFFRNRHPTLSNCKNCYLLNCLLPASHPRNPKIAKPQTANTRRPVLVAVPTFTCVFPKLNYDPSNVLIRRPLATTNFPGNAVKRGPEPR